MYTAQSAACDAANRSCTHMNAGVHRKAGVIYADIVIVSVNACRACQHILARNPVLNVGLTVSAHIERAVLAYTHDAV